MTQRGEIYKCDICGNLVEVLHPGMGRLVCCEKSMRLVKEKNQDIGLEKHTPVIEKVKGGVRVKVGSIEHPMEIGHYIEWIEVKIDGKVYKEFLKPGDKPEVIFYKEGKKIRARIYCNLHGLWWSQL